MRKEDKIDVDYDADELLSITHKIVDELLIVAGLKEADEDFKFMTKEELNAVPLSVRPQLSGSLIQRDIGEYSYIALLSQYMKWKETGGAGQMNTVFSWGTCKKSGIIKNIGRAKIC